MHRPREDSPTPLGDTPAVAAFLDLDALTLLESAQPFSAITLACCATDLLAHTVYRETTGEDAFTRAVKRLDGYDGPGIPESVYELRCGLVHEFRTHGESGRIAITGGSAIRYVVVS
jgi:hypothetical protein